MRRMRPTSPSLRATPGAEAARLVVFGDTQHDHPAGGVRQRRDVAGEVPLGLVAPAVQLGLELKVERLRHRVGNQRGDVRGCDLL
jgi:hypothetical protein